jgi:hypothetical protein
MQPAAVLAAPMTDTVTACDDTSSTGTLRQVIASAAAGDTVNFSCSATITRGSTIELDKSLTIDGSGQSVTISGGQTTTVTGVRVLIVGTASAVTLKYVTVANGNAGVGGKGGIDNFGTLTVTNSTFSGNIASFGQEGGGIASDVRATLTVTTAPSAAIALGAAAASPTAAR